MSPRSSRVVFLGNDAWSVPALEALVSSRLDPVLVVTREPRQAGRGAELTPTPVAEAARRLGVPLAEVTTVKSGAGFDRLAGAEPDFLVVVAYGEILPRAVLDLPTVAPVNLHFSLLPALRGPAPVQRAILEGLTETGVTTIVMDEGVDTGPILLQRREPILAGDDTGSLGGRLAGIGAEVLVETLAGMGTGAVSPTPQDERAATHAPRLGPEDRWLSWEEDAGALVRRVRALAPEPAASTRFRGEVLKVFRAEEADLAGPPGLILAVGKDGFAVGAGRGAVRPLEVAPAGRRRMTAGEFVRGYRPREGERLG